MGVNEFSLSFVLVIVSVAPGLLSSFLCFLPTKSIPRFVITEQGGSDSHFVCMFFFFLFTLLDFQISSHWLQNFTQSWCAEVVHVNY